MQSVDIWSSQKEDSDTMRELVFPVGMLFATNPERFARESPLFLSI
jgi:hypothetical protein